MTFDPTAAGPVATTIAPWLTVSSSAKAVAFYKAAFGASETYRMDVPDGTAVVRLSVNGAEFWVSDGAPKEGDSSPESVGGGTIRMILTVADPDASFARALAAGATEVFQVGEEYGWRLGRLTDPFGLHWEIGRQLSE